MPLEEVEAQREGAYDDCCWNDSHDDGESCRTDQAILMVHRHCLLLSARLAEAGVVLHGAITESDRAWCAGPTDEVPHRNTGKGHTQGVVHSAVRQGNKHSSVRQRSEQGCRACAAGLTVVGFQLDVWS